MEKKVLEVFRSRIGIDDDSLESGRTLEELSFDSVLIVELSVVFKEELEVVVDPGELHLDMTVADITELMTTKGANS